MLVNLLRPLCGTFVDPRLNVIGNNLMSIGASVAGYSCIPLGMGVFGMIATDLKNANPKKLAAISAFAIGYGVLSIYVGSQLVETSVLCDAIWNNFHN